MDFGEDQYWDFRIWTDAEEEENMFEPGDADTPSTPQALGEIQPNSFSPTQTWSTESNIETPGYT